MAQKDKLDLGEEKKPASSKKLLVIVLASVLVTLLAVFAALYFLGIFPPKPAADSGHPATTAESGEHAGADADADADAEAEDEEAHGKKAKKHGEHGEVPMLYEELEPAFVVNFQPNPEARILQIGISVASEDQAAIDAVKKHTPMIRNNLLMLMSAEDPAQLKTAEGKEALRAKILEEINAIVKKQARKKDAIEEVYFTAFIMQ
jgi:flagellar FliL protein